MQPNMHLKKVSRLCSDSFTIQKIDNPTRGRGNLDPLFIHKTLTKETQHQHKCSTWNYELVKDSHILTAEVQCIFYAYLV